MRLLNLCNYIELTFENITIEPVLQQKEKVYFPADIYIVDLKSFNFVKRTTEPELPDNSSRDDYLATRGTMEKTAEGGRGGGVVAPSSSAIKQRFFERCTDNVIVLLANLPKDFPNKYLT